MHEDAEQLVRFDLSQTARRAGDACAALVIETATTPAQWLAAATNLRRARTFLGSHVPGLHAAGERLGRALASLADACGMEVSQWISLARDERAEAQS